MFDIIMEQSFQARVARAIVKQKCIKIRNCRMEIANETWRYRHGVLSVELEELKKLWDRYQYILKLYDKNMGVIKKKRKPRYMDFDY